QKPALTANSGDFAVSFVAPVAAAGEVPAPLRNVQTALAPVFSNQVVSAVANFLQNAFNLVSPVDIPTVDPSLTLQRKATPQTRTFQGVAVTAIPRDDIEEEAVGSGKSIAATPELSTAAAVVTNRTSAYIGDRAKVNQVAGASTPQTVFVTAGSDVSHLNLA